MKSLDKTVVHAAVRLQGNWKIWLENLGSVENHVQADAVCCKCTFRRIQRACIARHAMLVYAWYTPFKGFTRHSIFSRDLEMSTVAGVLLTSYSMKAVLPWILFRNHSMHAFSSALLLWGFKCNWNIIHFFFVVIIYSDWSSFVKDLQKRIYWKMISSYLCLLF